MNNLSRVTEIEVLFRPQYKVSERPKICSSKDAYALLRSSWKIGVMQFTEEFKTILLNSANRVLGIVDIAKGGKDYVPVDMKVVFSIALKASASKIILAHNHPSGTLEPSPADKSLTKKVIEASKVLDIEICDHIIISNEGYFSFKDGSLM